MTRLLALAALALCTLSPVAAHASPNGPELTLGGLITPETDQSGSSGSRVHIGRMVGPTLRLGYELGNYVNHEFGVQLTRAAGTATTSGMSGEVSLLTIAGGYRLTWNILGRGGFTPFVGGGLFLGSADIEASATSGGFTAVRSGSVFTIILDGVAGARYTFPFGLDVRAELAVSTYGGFMGTLQPSAAVGYTF